MEILNILQQTYPNVNFTAERVIVSESIDTYEFNKLFNGSQNMCYYGIVTTQKTTTSNLHFNNVKIDYKDFNSSNDYSLFTSLDATQQTLKVGLQFVGYKITADQSIFTVPDGENRTVFEVKLWNGPDLEHYNGRLLVQGLGDPEPQEVQIVNGFGALIITAGDMKGIDEPDNGHQITIGGTVDSGEPYHYVELGSEPPKE